MASKYKVKLIKPHLHLKKGSVMELSRDNASLFVNKLKLARYIANTKTEEK